MTRVSPHHSSDQAIVLIAGFGAPEAFLSFLQATPRLAFCSAARCFSMLSCDYRGPSRGSPHAVGRSSIYSKHRMALGGAS